MSAFTRLLKTARVRLYAGGRESAEESGEERGEKRARLSLVAPLGSTLYIYPLYIYYTYSLTTINYLSVLLAALTTPGAHPCSMKADVVQNRDFHCGLLARFVAEIGRVSSETKEPPVSCTGGPEFETAVYVNWRNYLARCAIKCVSVNHWNLVPSSASMVRTKPPA